MTTSRQAVSSSQTSPNLQRRKDLIPVDGYARLRNDANRDAIEKTKAAEAAADRAYAGLETALEDATLPTFEPGREQLARDEAALAISNGDPDLAAIQLALDGNDEAVAALLSPWGRTLLAARGVREPERVLRDVRKVAVDRALRRGDSAAAKALRDHFGKLGAAKGVAGSAVRHRNPHRL